ncbi:MAG: aspartate dehydrogenase [Lachnospiraceae bacterium]|nr:aspartate dehydrogenase [Lachnospiraceae bacterium]
MHIFRKKEKPHKYDPSEQMPAVRCSICTGEQVAGFKDIRTGVFHEETLLRDPSDLEVFMKKYGLTEEPVKIY